MKVQRKTCTKIQEEEQRAERKDQVTPNKLYWKEVRLESQPDRGFHPFKGVIIFSFVEKLFAGHGVGTHDIQISML